MHFLTGQLGTMQQIIEMQAVTAGHALSREAKSRFLETEGKTDLQSLEHFLLPFLYLTGTGHMYSGSSIVLCLEFRLVVSVNLCCPVLLDHLVPFLYSLPPGLLVTKELNCLSFCR